MELRTVDKSGLDETSLDEAALAETLRREVSARETVSANPRDQRAQQLLCELLVRQNRLDDAATALRKAIVWLPDVPSLRIQLAFVLARQGRHQAARQTLSQAAEQTPPGSRIHRELIETAASTGPAHAQPSPAPVEIPPPAAADSVAHASALDARPAETTVPPGVALGLDDLAPSGTADLVRAGQGAKARLEDDDFDNGPGSGQGASALPSASSVPSRRWKLRLWRRKPVPTSWRLAGLGVVAAVVAWQASALVGRRIASAPKSETHLMPGKSLTVAMSMRTPLPKPPDAPAKPPAASTQAAIVAPPPRPPVGGMALPDMAMPIVTLRYAAASPASRQLAEVMATRLKAAGIAVTNLQPSSPGAAPGIVYFFEDDRPAAASIADSLGVGVGKLPIVAVPPEGGKLPPPGTIDIDVPANTGAAPR